MARKSSKTNDQRIAELEAKIEKKKNELKKLTSSLDTFKAKMLEEEFSELNNLIKSKNIDIQQVITYVNSL